MKETESKQKPPLFNAHTHIFNLDDVNNGFLKSMIPLKVIIITAILLLGSLVSIYFAYMHINIWELKLLVILLLACLSFLLIFFLYLFIFQPKLHWILETFVFRWIIKRLAEMESKSFDSIGRYANIVFHSYNLKKGEAVSQEDIFERLQSYYPTNTKFVTLSMDLDYMADCKKPRGGNFHKQLSDVEKIKANPKYTDKIYPFIHVDPRRVYEEEGYFNKLKTYVTSGTFQGFKVYPALGYFPFDWRLKAVYDLALELDLPITTHCAIGPVFYRGKLKTLKDEVYYNAENDSFIHPFTKNELQGKSPKEFTPHFTHPLNFYCLMHEHQLLADFWTKSEKKYNKDNPQEYTAKDVEKYKNLKYCLGHYGGSKEWEKYLKDPWLPEQGSALTIDKDLYHLAGGAWVHKVSGKELEKTIAHSWHSIISDMLSDKKSFPYLYSDISYNLSDKNVLPLLKIRLENNPNIANKILFGTDFFMVSIKASEREITMNVRAYIGEKHFSTIASKNPLDFLESKITSREVLKKVD